MPFINISFGLFTGILSICMVLADQPGVHLDDIQQTG